MPQVRGAVVKIAIPVLALVLSACSVGAHYTPEGPHPRIVVAGALHVGPVEVLHTPVSNAKPVTDLTVATANIGKRIGPVDLSIGAGWQVSRMWGACDTTGHACDMTWTDGWVAAAGATYQYDRFRVDLRGFSYDNSPVGARGNLPLGLEALVLLFGFGL